jgi:hypothetical protein
MVSRLKKFEMKGYYHTTVEMYRDTTDHRNIHKQVGAMQEKYRRGDKPFATYKTKNRKRRRTTAEQERYNEEGKKETKVMNVLIQLINKY